MASVLRSSVVRTITAAPSGVAVVTRFLRYRAAEIVVWMGIPVIGLLASDTRPMPSRTVVFFIATAMLMSHVLLYNDWGGVQRNPAEVLRVGLPALSQRQTRSLLFASLASLVIAIGLYATLSSTQAMLAAAGGVMSVLYSHPRIHWKEGAAASGLHFASGLVKFLLGYLTVSSAWLRGALLGVFFSLVFVAGHLIHQCIDYDEDRRGGLKTLSVRYGIESLWLVGIGVFAASHFYILVLAALPGFDGCALAVFSLPLMAHGWVLWASRARPVASSEILLDYRNSYRRLFALSSLGFVLLSHRH